MKSVSVTGRFSVIFYFEHLYVIFIFADVYKYRDRVGIVSAVKRPDCILLPPIAAFVYQCKALRTVCLKEAGEYFLSLIAAAFAAFVEKVYFKVIGKPGGEPFGIPLLDVFAYGHKDISLARRC